HYRLGSDLAKPLSDGAHVLIDALHRAGFELDVVSPRLLHEPVPGRYRAVLYAHPFGATPEDVAALARWQEHGAIVIAHGLPPVAGEGYAGADTWGRLGIELPQRDWHELRSADTAELLQLAALEGFAVDVLARLGLTPAWRIPAGAIASRTQL